MKRLVSLLLAGALAGCAGEWKSEATASDGERFAVELKYSGEAYNFGEITLTGDRGSRCSGTFGAVAHTMGRGSVDCINGERGRLVIEYTSVIRSAGVVRGNLGARRFEASF